MWTVYQMQWKRLIKNPLFVLLFSGLTLLMVNVIAGSQGSDTIPVRVYSETFTTEQLADRVEELNHNASFDFIPAEADKVRKDIRMDNYSFALELNDDAYQYLVGRESSQLPIVEQYVNQFYREKKIINEVKKLHPEREVKLKEAISFDVSSLSTFGSGITNISVMLGMTFYFSIYSIMFLMTKLFEEKTYGTWNRLIFSPVSKTRIYIGHLLFYFSIGVIQIFTLLIILSQMLSIKISGHYLTLLLIILAFILSIVSLGILLTALAKSISALQVVIPIVATSMAMIGGAFWPLQLVDNPILLFAAELMPIKHAVYGIVETLVYNKSLLDSLEPIGYLLLYSVLFMGIGINLMERATE